MRLTLSSLLLLAITTAGCTDRKASADVGPLPVAPTAYPTGPASTGPGVAEISTDIQAITIHIVDGRFDADVYDLQSRPVRLEVSSEGGPFTLSIDQLLEPRSLDADGITIIGLSLPDPGKYTMHLNGAGTDTATLDVRPPGDR
jgi:hypothetical protein